MLDKIRLNEADLRSSLELDLFEMTERDAFGVDDFSSEHFEKPNLSHLPPGIRWINFSDSQCSHASAWVSSARMSRCRSLSILMT